jgi:Tol biopolymer transport system component
MGILHLILPLLLCAGPTGQIAFVAGQTQATQQAYIADLATGAVNATGPPGIVGSPRWSPNRQWLALEQRQGQAQSIHLAQADENKAQALQHRHQWNSQPRWSPHSDALAYTAGAGPGRDQQLVVYDLAKQQETVWAGGRTGLLRPVWIPSPILMRSLFARGRSLTKDLDIDLWEQESDLGVVCGLSLETVAGRKSTEIFLATRSQILSVLPFFQDDSLRYAEWHVEPAPDGASLAFESNDGGDREVFVLNSKSLIDISNHRAADWNPVWSKDSRWVAFESFRKGHRGVYRAYPETSRVFPVAAASTYQCWSPAWSSDGAWLAWVSDRAGRPQIYLSDPDGGHRRRLRDLIGGEDKTVPLSEYAPAWRPESGP